MLYFIAILCATLLAMAQLGPYLKNDPLPVAKIANEATLEASSALQYLVKIQVYAEKTNSSDALFNIINDFVSLNLNTGACYPDYSLCAYTSYSGETFECAPNTADTICQLNDKLRSKGIQQTRLDNITNQFIYYDGVKTTSMDATPSGDGDSPVSCDNLGTTTCSALPNIPLPPANLSEYSFGVHKINGILYTYAHKTEQSFIAPMLSASEIENPSVQSVIGVYSDGQVIYSNNITIYGSSGQQTIPAVTYTNASSLSDIPSNSVILSSKRWSNNG
jgi:hypothetical protein